MPRRKLEMRTFVVKTVTGEDYVVRSHYVFDNGLAGLVFRQLDPPSEKTKVVASFAHGQWAYFRETDNGQERFL